MGNQGRKTARLLGALAVAITATLAGHASAADNKPITVVVATSPGTSGDLIARKLGEQFAKKFDTSLVVDNKPGASGNIGAEYVAHARPDGSTLLVAATTFATNASLNVKLPYDPVKDFEPIALLGRGTLVLAVPANFPANTLKEFVAMAKATPGKINYASPGNGTPQHLAMELFKQEAGIDLFHVPYRATGTAVTDLAGGQVSAMIVPLTTVSQLISAGRLKVLAVMSSERDDNLPNAPTFRELGYDRVQLSTWYGLLAPKGTPPDVVKRLNQQVNEALKVPDVVDNLSKQGIKPAGGAPELMAKTLSDEINRWPPVVKAAHITAD